MNNFGLSIDLFGSLPVIPVPEIDLRSDQIGKTGAAAKYRGKLAATRDASVRRFAAAHILTELRFLRFFERWMPQRHRSRLLPVWRSAGWLVGSTAAQLGRRAGFRTVAAVETYVEGPYLEQIETMKTMRGLENLVIVLSKFCEDEVDCRNDDHQRVEGSGGPFARAWANIIATSSALGVQIARRVYSDIARP